MTRTRETGQQPPTGTRMSQPSTERRVVMLSMATLGFAVNFWAWALLSPLGPLFKDSLG